MVYGIIWVWVFVTGSGSAKFVTLPQSMFARERLALAEGNLQTMQLSRIALKGSKAEIAAVKSTQIFWCTAGSGSTGVGEAAVAIGVHHSLTILLAGRSHVRRFMGS